MGIFDYFLSEREKSHRRNELARSFDAAIESYCDTEERLQYFISTEDNIFISYSNKFKSVGIFGRSPLDCDGENSCTRLDRQLNRKIINLSELHGFAKTKNEYQDLKKQNLPWEDILEALSFSMCDLITEAVFAFERKYNLPRF